MFSQYHIAQNINIRDFSRGEKGAFCPPVKIGFAPPELCLNDKIDFNMIKVLLPCIFERINLPP